MFIQDAWTVNNRLTINAGLRTERERVPTYTTQVGRSRVRHRIRLQRQAGARLGFAYDVKGDGRSKVFGSWGVFYDIFKLELPRGSFGGDKWLEYYYALDTYDWPNLVSGCGMPAGMPGAAAERPG